MEPFFSRVAGRQHLVRILELIQGRGQEVQLHGATDLAAFRAGSYGANRGTLRALVIDEELFQGPSFPSPMRSSVRSTAWRYLEQAVTRLN